MTGKKNIISIIIVVFVFAVILAMGILALCGVFGGNDTDYVRTSNARHIKDLVSSIAQVAAWNETAIYYEQIYDDGQKIIRRTEETGSGIDGYEMYHTLIVTGLGAYEEKCSYSDRTLVTLIASEGRDQLVTTENIHSINRFAEIKKEFSGDCFKYLGAFTADVFSDIYVLRHGDEIYYKVIFDEERTDGIMGKSSERLQLLVSVKDGKTETVRFMYDKKANPELSDDSSSSVILEFTKTINRDSWEILSDLIEKQS